jgi:hypothetical protein
VAVKYGAVVSLTKRIELNQAVLKQYSWHAFARIQGLLQIVVFVLLLMPSAARWFRRKRNNDTAVTIRT